MCPLILVGQEMNTDIFSTLPVREPPTSDGYNGGLDEYPEIDFRELDAESRGETVSTSYLTHSLQKHPATFIPQIPSYLISEYAPEEGGVVMDVFGGSGTTGVEAVRQGHEYIGVEVNPLSKLVSDVSTHPLPLDLLEAAFGLFTVVSVEEVRDEVEFPGRTKKEFWFEESARVGLEELRNKVFAMRAELEELEIRDGIVEATAYSRDEIREQVWEVFVLVFANVVFHTSNADPGVSKAYKSPIMKDAIDSGEHPPDVKSKFVDEWSRVTSSISGFWDVVLENNSSVPESTTILGDARDVEIKKDVDITISSPPYINAINYYRGSKLRLFWIADMLAELDVPMEAAELRKSIIGSNSGASLRSVDTDTLPFTLRDVWRCEPGRYSSLSLNELDSQIQRIHDCDISDAPKKGYLVWKFFSEDMVQSMSSVYDALVDDGLFFFVIGENVVGGEFIETRKYLVDIGRHLGCFETSELSVGEEFTHCGTAFDEITNRELFQSRNHDGGVIECEWAIAFRK